MNWESAGNAIAGIIMSGIIGIGMISIILFFVGTVKGDHHKNRRRRSTYRPAYRPKFDTPDFRYVVNTHVGNYFVYFLKY